MAAKKKAAGKSPAAKTTRAKTRKPDIDARLKGD